MVVPGTFSIGFVRNSSSVFAFQVTPYFLSGAEYIVKSYASTVAERLRHLYTRREVQCPPETEARQLYQSWADAGITHDDLHAAMSGVEGALEGDNAVATPADLSPRLWPRVVDGWERQLAA